MDGIFIWCLDGALLGILAGMWLKGHDMSLALSLFLGITGAFAGAIICLALTAHSSPLYITLFMLLLGAAAMVMLVQRVNRY